jgi:hypothetical protein
MTKKKAAPSLGAAFLPPCQMGACRHFVREEPLAEVEFVKK